jgi:hypothetical protein
VWVRNQARSNSYAKILFEVLKIETETTWTPEEVGIQSETETDSQPTTTQPQLVVRQSIAEPDRQQTVVRPIELETITKTLAQTIESSDKSQPQARDQQERHTRKSRDYYPYERFSATPYPQHQQSRSGEIVRPPVLARLLTDLMKVYNQDSQKYGGDQYDILNYKLQIFYNVVYQDPAHIRTLRTSPHLVT